MLKVVLSGRAYIGEGLIQILSELLEKQVYVLNECFKYKFWDSRQSQREEKNDGCVKIFLMTGRTLYGELQVNNSSRRNL